MVDWTLQHTPLGETEPPPPPPDGIRTVVIGSYEIPKLFYKNMPKSPVKKVENFGVYCWYACKYPHAGRKPRKLMDVDVMVQRWHTAVVGLVMAHDKDEADRYESTIDDCLSPILTAPVRQIRELVPKLLASLKADPKVPFLVWRAYEAWIETVVKTATDEDVKELKTALAAEIVALVEEDAKEQLPEAMMRALQWRNPEKLQEVKDVVSAEKKKGNKTRLVGKESCLFLWAGGTEDEPKVCIQI